MTISVLYVEDGWKMSPHLRGSKKLLLFQWQILIFSIYLAFSKHKYKLSRGEICVQISFPPLNGASQGNYFLPKWHKLAVFEEKQAYKNSSGSQTCKLFFKFDGLKVRYQPVKTV